MKFDEKFAKNLTRNAVILMGTVTDLSIEINASEKSIYKWMNGVGQPDAMHLLAMLNLMGYLVNPQVKH